MSRRVLLGAGVGSVAALLAQQETFNLQSSSRIRVKRKPKNIIFIVFDGMAVSVPSMVHHYKQLLGGKGSVWAELMDDPEVAFALQETRSLSSVVTDSSAASSTWGSGRRIMNGMVNMYPDGTKLKTLMQIMKGQGVKCGLVTTTTMTHATPAGFAVNCLDREWQPLIAEMYPEVGVDVLMGGGNMYFAADKRVDKKDAYELYRKAGYQILRDRGDLTKMSSGKVLGIFSDSHLPYSVDWKHDQMLARKTPKLSELVGAAIQNLRGSKNGFLLQIEAGRVDHACHANDVSGMFYDQIEGEEAVRVALEFAREDQETLVIITADHACGGPNLNGAGYEYKDATEGLLTLTNMRSSVSNVVSEIKALGKDDKEKITVGSVRDLIEEHLALKITQAEGEYIVQAAKGGMDKAVPEFKRGLTECVGDVVGNYTKVTYTSTNHTNDHVLVSAFGPGKEVIHGLVENTSFFHIMLAMKGLSYENPYMSAADAREHYERMKKSFDPDWLRTVASSPDDDCCHHI